MEVRGGRFPRTSSPHRSFLLFIFYVHLPQCDSVTLLSPVFKTFLPFFFFVRNEIKDKMSPGMWRQVTRPTGPTHRCIMVRGDDAEGSGRGLDDVL